MSRITGPVVNGRWCAYMKYTRTVTDTSVKITVTEIGFHCSSNNYKSINASAKLTAKNNTYSVSGKTVGGTTGKDYPMMTTARTFTYTRDEEISYFTSIDFTVTCSGDTVAPGKSATAFSVDVPSKPKPVYIPPSITCKAYRVNSDTENIFNPSVDSYGTKGYFTLTYSGGSGFEVLGANFSIDGATFPRIFSMSRVEGTNTFYGYTSPDYIPGTDRVTIKGSLRIATDGLPFGVGCTTYISPTSVSIDATKNAIAIGRTATDGYSDMTFEVGCAFKTDQDQFKVRLKTTASRSWATGGTAIGDLNYTPDEIEGYIPIAAVGAYTGSSAVIPMVRYNYADKKFNGRVRNMSSNAVSTSLYIEVLYVQSGLMGGQPGFNGGTSGGETNPPVIDPSNPVISGIKTTRKTSEEWAALPDYVPENNELIIYTTMLNENGIPVLQNGLKIGDGDTFVGDLPFIGAPSQTLNHKLTIGDAVFDGSEDVTIRIYGGDYE